MLLAKFHIQDNPMKFALYEQLQDHDDQGLFLLCFRIFQAYRLLSLTVGDREASKFCFHPRFSK